MGSSYTPASGSGTSIPAGVVAPYAGTSAPTGWLLAYGQAVSRETYSDLFTAISDTYGAGDGSTTFNLPDLRGRVAAGKDNMGGSAANRLTTPIDGTILGDNGGSQNHTLVADELPAHTHNYDQASGTVNAGAGGDVSAIASLTPAQATSSTGGGSAHNNVQPTLVLNYIIKT